MADTELRLNDYTKRLLASMPRAVAHAIFDGVRATLIDAERISRQYYFSGGNRLHTRTGTLMRSITSRVDRRGTRTIGTFGVAKVVYAKIHEKGGTIRAKPGGWLTIPTKFAKTPAGVARGSARSFSNTFFLPAGRNKATGRRRKHPMIMQKVGQGVIPLFVLVKSVKIPKRPFLRPALEQAVEKLDHRIVKALKKRMG